MKTIHIDEIQPVGNFESILLKIKEKADLRIKQAHDEQKYNESLGKIIKFIVAELGLIDVLEEGLETGKTWNMEENLLCLLYTRLMIIDLNQTAHTYVNKDLNIEWSSRAQQLQESIDDKPHIYKGLKIIE